MPRRIQLTWCLFLMVVAGVMLAPNARAQLMPDYRLGVGSALIFEVRKEHQVAGKVLTRTGTNTVFVIGQKPNGNWLMVLTGVTTAKSVKGDVLKTTEELNYFEMTARGKILYSDAPVISETHRDCFVALPEVATNVLSSWDVTWALRGDTQHYVTHPASDPARGKWIWTRTDGGVQRELHGVTRTATALFNAQAGLMERMETRFEMNTQGSRIRGATISQLRRSDILLDYKLKKLVAQSATFKTLRSEYLDALSGVVSSPQEPVAHLKNAAQPLTAATNTLTYPEISRALHRMLASHEATHDIILGEANYWRPRIGVAAPPWRSDALAGKPILSDELKNHVTVLHVWQPDSVVSVRGLRHMNALATRFEGKPVKVLSAVIDGDLQKAATAVAATQVQHPVINGVPLLQSYPVRGLPTVLVFDAKGVLRDVRFGTHAYRQGALASKIAQLLQE